MHPAVLLSDVADLVLGRCCLVCQAIGPQMCKPCLDGLRSPARRVPLSGALPVTVAAVAYAGAAQRMVLAYKEDGHRSLATPLGVLLADAVDAVLAPWRALTCTLIPIPSHRRPRRGFDALAAVVRHAQRELLLRGVQAKLAARLRHDVDYEPAKTLTRAERQRQLAGAFVARPLALDERAGSADPVIVVDDVITTGATVTEAVRALRQAGIAVHAIAAVAAAERPGR